MGSGNGFQSVRRDYWSGSEKYSGLFHPLSGAIYVNEFPYYSEEICSAWEVFEYLTKNAIELSLRPVVSEDFSVGHDSNGWSCSVWWYKNIQSAHKVEGVYALTAPLAICRAALIAHFENEAAENTD